MAQRAYRQRKESTLDELRKRVSDLSNTVEVMNKLFGECKDRLYASNLAEVQMFDLHDTATEFETLVKDARHHPSDDSESQRSDPSLFYSNRCYASPLLTQP